MKSSVLNTSLFHDSAPTILWPGDQREDPGGPHCEAHCSTSPNHLHHYHCHTDRLCWRRRDSTTSWEWTCWWGIACQRLFNRHLWLFLMIHILICCCLFKKNNKFCFFSQVKSQKNLQDPYCQKQEIKNPQLKKVKTLQQTLRTFIIPVI